MASGVPLNASDFTARREQGRAFTDNSAPPSRPLLSKYQHPPEPPTHRNQQQQGLQFPLNADIAYRRQLNRQTLGEELKFVGPPTIISPDSLPVKKRSSITLIEKSQQTMHQHPPGDIAALASQVASFQLSPVKRPPGTFDDTDSMTTGPDYAADHDAGNRHHPIAVATDYNKGNPASNPNLKYVASEHANQMRGQIINGEDEGYARGYYAQGEDRGAGFELGPDWRADVADEKALRGVTPDPNTRGYYAGPTQVETRGMYAESSVNLNEEYDEYNHEYQQDDEVGYEVGDADGARTPTQTDNFPARNEFDDTLAINARGKSIEYMPAMPANIISAPEPVKGPTANQTQKNTATKSMAPPPKPSANKKVDDGKRPVHNSEFPIPMRTTTPPTNINEAKATSFGDSSPEQTSEDELSLPDPTAATAHKRAFEDSLDYTRDELADKSYSDLDREPFLTDPNGPARSQPAVEQTLEQKLSYMTSMSEEERKAMFEAMTDAENEGTGEWFTKQMKEKMEKLMRAKHNRRMIAAKYEHEVKKRHALVNAKTKDVADELAGLKSGLGNLMPTPKPADKKERREALKTEKKAAKKAGKKGEASK